MITRLKKFFHLSSFEKKLLAEAILFIFTAKFVTVVLPFKVCLRLVSNPASSTTETDNDISPELLQSVKTALQRGGRLAFWKNVCLVQSIAAKWMLRRRSISSTLIFGFTFNENNSLIAHAWVRVDDFEIVAKSGDYKELHTV